jgi:hypothetical protein
MLILYYFIIEYNVVKYNQSYFNFRGYFLANYKLLKISTFAWLLKLILILLLDINYQSDILIFNMNITLKSYVIKNLEWYLN